MCGIAGVFHFDRTREVNGRALKSMTDVIHHRGPDGEGFFLENNIGLGHRRLSIIDLHTGDQPMFSYDRKKILVFNGEIYNYIELREELIKKGYKFRTDSDTEVVIKAYEEWGYECQNKFNGMWAFALWNKDKDELFLSRDRLGEKPLHYGVFEDTLLFGSEIKSFFAYGMPKIPQLELLEIYTVYKSIPAPYTFFKEINKLMPGHYIISNRSGFNEYKYWDLPEIDESNLMSDKKYIHEKFTELFYDSVKIRMRSDVPFGAFLSGGLDSSSIVALMSKISPYPVKTFTIGYDEKEFDETDLASLVAKQFKTDHVLGKVEEGNFDDLLDKIAFHYDEPFGDSSAIPTGYVSKFASEHVKMVLTGDGGDELLSGYSSYQGVKLSQKYQQLPLFMQHQIPKGINAFSKLAKGSTRYKLNRYSNLFSTASKKFDSSLLDKRAKPSVEIIKQIISPDVQTFSVQDYTNDFLKKIPYKDDFYKQMYLNFKFDLPNDYLVKVDRMSMANSLETRLPFLDHRLVEFMANVDKKVKMVGWERKSILRNTIAKELPPQLMKASKKGFRVPVREWFKKEEIKNKANNFSQNATYINDKYLSKIIEGNFKGLDDHGNLLWALMVLDKVTKDEVR